MLIDVTKLDKYEKRKNKPDLRFQYMLQNKVFSPIIGSIYWYRWDKYAFDIRDLREKFGVKRTKSIDTDFDMNQCTKYLQILREIKELVGNLSFFEAMNSNIAKIEEVDRGISITINSKGGCISDLPNLKDLMECNSQKKVLVKMTQNHGKTEGKIVNEFLSKFITATNNASRMYPLDLTGETKQTFEPIIKL